MDITVSESLTVFIKKIDVASTMLPSGVEALSLVGVTFFFLALLARCTHKTVMVYYIYTDK